MDLVPEKKKRGRKAKVATTDPSNINDAPKCPKMGSW